jgi:hypothetical protein
MTKEILLALCLLIVAPLPITAYSQAATVENEAGMSVAQLEAATVALRQFKLDQPTADTRNVFVSVSESGREFKVAFLPKQNSSEVGHEGSTDYITMDNPKGNQFGRYVEYRISKKTKKIVGSAYAR